MGNETDTLTALREERIQLEREALELERARLEAARARSERVAGERSHSLPRGLVLAASAVLWLATLLVGYVAGSAVADWKSQQAREARIRATLSQLSSAEVSTTTVTNSADVSKSTGPVGSHRNVSVVVIE